MTGILTPPRNEHLAMWKRAELGAIPWLRSASLRLLNPSFWDNGASWPEGGDDIVFAGLALQECGQAMSPSDWTGKEIGAFSIMQNFPNFVPPLLRVTSAPAPIPARRTGIAALLSPEASSLMPSASPALPRNDEHVRQYYYKVEREKWLALTAENDAALYRLRRAIGWLAAHAKNGRLKTKLRAKNTAVGGGFYLDAPDDLWNVEPVAEHRYRDGSFRYLMPGFQAPIDFYAFFTRDSLDRCLAELTASMPVEIEEAAGVHVSPYLHLALAVARELAIAPGNQLKKSTIIEKINEMAPAHGLGDKKLLSPSAIEYLAQFIREPGSTLGRAASRDGSDP